MGDFSANFKRPEAGIHTVEGTVAGSRAAQLEKKRKADQDAFEQRKQQIVHDRHIGSKAMRDKFAGGSGVVEDAKFKAQTVGLVSAQHFKQLAQQQAKEEKTQKSLFEIDDDDDEDNPTNNNKNADDTKTKKISKKAKKKKLKDKKQALSKLSFAADEEEAALVEAALETPTHKKDNKDNKKDPTVDTSFLPDQQRDQHVQAERTRLEREWKTHQQTIQQEPLEITYSYWDGSGHRRTVICKKGDSIGDFLEQVRVTLAKEFKELGTVGADALLYVKEDLIIPQDLTFYDLIATKARGKSGPLFHFDVHDDVRVGVVDSRVEKDESHPGKVVERRWYDRYKHIFPASRWEWYDPKKDYGNYTIGDFNKKK